MDNLSATKSLFSHEKEEPSEKTGFGVFFSENAFSPSKGKSALRESRFLLVGRSRTFWKSFLAPE